MSFLCSFNVCTLLAVVFNFGKSNDFCVSIWVRSLTRWYVGGILIVASWCTNLAEIWYHYNFECDNHLTLMYNSDFVNPHSLCTCLWKSGLKNESTLLSIRNICMTIHVHTTLHTDIGMFFINPKQVINAYQLLWLLDAWDIFYKLNYLSFGFAVSEI